jgi:hypothetical protein
MTRANSEGWFKFAGLVGMPSGWVAASHPGHQASWPRFEMAGPDQIRSTSHKIARSDAQSQEARNRDNHDQDADDVEKVHWALRLWHARASYVERAPKISLAAERSSI